MTDLIYLPFIITFNQFFCLSKLSNHSISEFPTMLFREVPRHNLSVCVSLSLSDYLWGFNRISCQLIENLWLLFIFVFNFGSGSVFSVNTSAMRSCTQMHIDNVALPLFLLCALSISFSFTKVHRMPYTLSNHPGLKYTFMKCQKWCKNSGKCVHTLP